MVRGLRFADHPGTRLRPSRRIRPVFPRAESVPFQRSRCTVDSLFSPSITSDGRSPAGSLSFDLRDCWCAVGFRRELSGSDPEAEVTASVCQLRGLNVFNARLDAGGLEFG